MKFILFGGDNKAELGGKASALHDLQSAGFRVPPWFVVPPQAFRSIVGGPSDAIEMRLADTLSPSSEFVTELNDALTRIAPNGEFFAVRSSASGEDSFEHSFAGQLESYLGVSRENVWPRIVDVWRSGFSERILAYRNERGIKEAPPLPAVIVQVMINATSSGVAFSADPVTGRRAIAVVSSVFGLASTLVGGEAEADTFRVNRELKVVESTTARKTFSQKLTSSGVADIPVPEEEQNSRSLADPQVSEVTSLVLECEKHFGLPQDIEWAYDRERLWLLQSRPISSLTALADPDGGAILWDNSNIAESYGGISSPLTFSFVRRIYEEVYLQFCRILGVSDTVLNENADTFRRMLGHIRGRIYYNLLSWYRMLAILPGYTFNRKYMEQMMGVKESLPEEFIQRVAVPSESRVEAGLHLLRTCAGLLKGYVTLNRSIRRFYARLDDALRLPAQSLEKMRIDELSDHYFDLEKKLITRWDAPLVNDFMAMIFYGVLRKLCHSWCGDEGGTLQNDLIMGGGDIISAEPARRMKKLAELASDDTHLLQVLKTGGVDEIHAVIEGRPAFRAEYESYLAKFGDRCLEELKLETATLHDDPTMMFRSIAQLASSDRREGHTVHVPEQMATRAEERVRSALQPHPFKKPLFDWVLRNARDRVRDRENLRFERTRLFGRVRKIFLEIGKRLHSEGILGDPRDIFFLEIYEVLGFIDGTATTTELGALVALRKKEFEKWENGETPADRFETRGAVHIGNRFLPTKADVALSGDTLKGLGCCPGVVRAKVRVIRDPKNAVLEKGSILVAERTDPGWIMLFPAAAGLLVERGSLLSHSAIVARELALPAVVSISGLTNWLRDGDLVEMDGSTGMVKKLESTEGI